MGDVGELSGLENISEDVTDETDEVAIFVDTLGKLIARASQVADYQLWDASLNNICVWDFVAQVEKINKGCPSEQEYDHKSDINNDTIETDDESVIGSPSGLELPSAIQLLDVQTRICPSCVVAGQTYGSCLSCI